MKSGGSISDISVAQELAEALDYLAAAQLKLAEALELLPSPLGRITTDRILAAADRTRDRLIDVRFRLGAAGARIELAIHALADWRKQQQAPPELVKKRHDEQ
jgi:hypothetical protein